MKHLARVVIENFQSHERSELAFTPGLNVIVGPSDNGKSAVLRALRWALYNEPRGTEFVRAGCRECRVTITMSDGAEILREVQLHRSGSIARNRYVISLPGAEPQVFEGFGTEPPPDVARAHGMPRVQLDTDKQVLLNFGGQLEGPFLMAETGSFRARAIGRLLGVHVVDAAVRETQRDLKAVKGDVTRLEKDLQRFVTELAPFSDILQEESRLELTERTLDRAESLAQRVARLEALRAEFDRAEADEIRLEAACGRLEEAATAGGLVARAEGLQRRAAQLERLAQELARIDRDSERCRARVDALRALPLAEELAGRLSLLSQRAVPLREIEAGLAEAAAGAAAAERDLRQALAEYEAALRALGRCPTCMQPVAEEAVPAIIAELAGGPGSGHTH